MAAARDQAVPDSSQPRNGSLVLVGTPIGNLGDLSPRAREAFTRAELVACEDTRRTGKLLHGLDLRRPLLSFHTGNERERMEGLLDKIRSGACVALATDAGMPGVADPGYSLVRTCLNEGLRVDVVPGPSAVLTALLLSGLPMERFVFEGFWPRKASERRAQAEALREEQRTVVVFESPRRLGALLRDLAAADLGERRAAVCREMTKLHEEIMRGTVADLAERVGGDALKGEVTLVIEGAPREAGDLDAAIEEARAQVASGIQKRTASREVAARTGVTANEIYRALIEPA
jgi:16S rRNA (cytidine1402-2'-O)-methyltransferase